RRAESDGHPACTAAGSAPGAGSPDADAGEDRTRGRARQAHPREDRGPAREACGEEPENVSGATMTDLYAVIGNPVAQTKSPRIHAEFARQLGQDLRYEAILAPRDGFAAAVAAFRAAGGRGLNVTVPFKLDAFALATERSDRAEPAGGADPATRHGATG